LNPSSTCIPLQGERRQDDERRHSDLYSRVNPVFCPNLVVLSHLKMVDQRRKTDDERHQALSLVGYEPNHDELCYERKRHVSTPSRKKCGHHICGGKRVLSPHRRVQGKPTSTRPEVIDATRQRQHREDHEDGHRYCGGRRRQVICICPAAIHQKQPRTLHLTVNRRTTTFSRCSKGA